MRSACGHGGPQLSSQITERQPLRGGSGQAARTAAAWVTSRCRRSRRCRSHQGAGGSGFGHGGRWFRFVPMNRYHPSVHGRRSHSIPAAPGSPGAAWDPATAWHVPCRPRRHGAMPPSARCHAAFSHVDRGRRTSLLHFHPQPCIFDPRPSTAASPNSRSGGLFTLILRPADRGVPIATGQVPGR